MVLEHVNLIQNKNCLKKFSFFNFLIFGGTCHTTINETWASLSFLDKVVECRLSNLRFFLGKKMEFWQITIVGPALDVESKLE